MRLKWSTIRNETNKNAEKSDMNISIEVELMPFYDGNIHVA